MIANPRSNCDQAPLLTVASVTVLIATLSACGDGSGSNEPAGAGDRDVPRATLTAGDPGLGRDATDADRLLARAIQALGGQKLLSSLEGVETLFEASRPGISMRGRICQQFPDRFRQEQDVWDATVVHVSNGEEAWKTIDGVRVDIEKEDRRQLEEQRFMARMSLLVYLQQNDRVALRALGNQDGYDWLEVKLGGSDLGPYLLGFDPKTMLLGIARYETFVYGHARKTPVSMRLSAYKSVSGIMVPFESCITVEGEPLEHTIHLKEIRFDPEINRSLFTQPEEQVVAEIHRRASQGFRALVLDDWKGDSGDACRLLGEAVSKNELERIGPPHFLYQGPERTACTVAYPIIFPTGSATSRPGMRADLALRTVPAADVLTTVVRGSSAELLEEAELRLKNEATRRGAAPSGSFRKVIWSEDIVQVQLPVK